MGSSGSGRITDYPGSSSASASSNGRQSGAPEDRCSRAFNVTFEDFEHSDYYAAHKTLPPIGTELEIAHRKRLVGQTKSGESVGNLPTQYNYLAACLKDGWRYVGAIRTAVNGPPVAKISADFAATPPK